jgi:dTDP-4-dehydrorhamnose reductase
LSTDYVFDGTKTEPYNESDPTNPLSVYGQSKLAGEQELSIHEHSLVVRLSWV